MKRKRDYRPPWRMSRNVARATHMMARDADIKKRAEAKKNAAPNGNSEAAQR